MSRSIVTGLLFTAMAVGLAVACAKYPDDKELPLIIAAAFGPFLGIRLDIPEGPIALVLTIGLAIPFILRISPITVCLLACSVALWLFVGYATGTLLYA